MDKSDQNQGEIILYQTPDNQIVLDVRFEYETIWLTQVQIVALFSASKANVSEHIKQIYKTKELEIEATVRNFRIVQHDRFVIIDSTTVYHIGASLKDLGKKLVVSLSNYGSHFQR